MKKIYCCLAILLLGNVQFAEAQEPEPVHFQPVYSGNPYLAMNFYLTAITIDDTTAEVGDEVGIFDGDICVGAGIVTGPLGEYLDLVAATDDPTTPEKDGFTPGNPIGFRLWDYSAQIEVRNISSIYTSGDAIFSSQGTAVLEIHGSSAQPTIQIISPVPDREVPEDTADFDIADLDTIFSVTPEGSALEFTTTSDTIAISVRLDEFNVAWVSLAENWNGTGQIFLSATLHDSTLSDTVLLTVTPVNDPPSLFSMISPVDGWLGGTTTLTFSWSASIDHDTGETPAYDFALSTDSSFAIVDTFINVGTDTTLTFDSLAPGKYYWKVSAYSGIDTVWGSESDQRPWSFTIMPVALESAYPMITHYRLDNNYPNPFNPTTTIRYELPRQSRVMLSIYDINGRAVANLVNATQPTGLYSVTWDAGDLGSGVYFYRIEVYSPHKNGTGEFRQVRKMILIK